MTTFTLEILYDQYTICRLDAAAQVPAWAKGAFVSVSRSDEELSVVCPQVNVPAQIPSERDWRCLRVEGPLNMSMVGVIASLTSLLATAKISVFVISTFDTDYLLVKEDDLDTAMESFLLAGHEVVEQFRPAH
jgi:hypothetical protein